MTAVLAIDELAVSFRTRDGIVPAVHGVSLEVRPGETVAVVGESGSGKSTTAAAVNRLLADNAIIDAGRIRFGDEDITDLDESRMRILRGASIGLVPQDPMSNLDPLMRVGDQIAEALEVHDLARGAALRERVIELLELVGISEPERRARQYPHEFSGGMRQRVLIAMGLACRPRLLIADEPTSALDVTVQRRILDRLEELTGEFGTAVLLITHDLALAAERADRVVVMYRGEIVEQGTAAEVLEQPQHDYTKTLLAAIPGLHTEIRERFEHDPQDLLLQATDLVKTFEVRADRGWRTGTFTAVDGVSIDIPRRATVSLVGESGSGKSTVASMVLGLLEPTSGRILFQGSERGRGSAELKAFRRQVQPVFQNPFASLDPRYTVARSIAEPLQVHRIGTAAERQRRVRELLEMVALPAAMESRLPHELSGGQRQRVAIARALALNPDLVVLDEAVSALDVLVQEQILELLDGLQRELGLAYLFISHDLAVVRMISDFVHVMQRGRVVESGTPQQIFTAPQQAYTRELLAAIPGASVT
ncbi:ABC transporter ATP-binding protein [Enemella evansiae]|uniref:ABC transporter ATP-binding protein n=1 Tax=Enemella evansiae TaxID=2016499 RepID=UPI000B9633C8|nr:ABC transporter ATP-binding protein [Enemella evansiae]OYO16947.1 ABC transporter ATP-binding protein [Enemella evansiae]